jgi:hypothetical protein
MPNSGKPEFGGGEGVRRDRGYRPRLYEHALANSGFAAALSFVIAGLVPAISLRWARPCLPDRDHRDSALRAGPAMTVPVVIDDKGNDFLRELNLG